MHVSSRMDAGQIVGHYNRRRLATIFDRLKLSIKIGMHSDVEN